MENDELRKFIKQSIREALHEILSWPDEKRRHEDYPYRHFLSYLEDRLQKDTHELESQVGRLSMLFSKFESWAASSGCKYDANDISEVKRLLASIDAKLP